MAGIYRCRSCRAHFRAPRRQCDVCGTAGVVTSRNACRDCGAALSDSRDQRCTACGSASVNRVTLD